MHNIAEKKCISTAYSEKDFEFKTNTAKKINDYVYFTDGEYLFADPDSKLSKYGPKSWRSSHTHVSLHWRHSAACSD